MSCVTYGPFLYSMLKIFNAKRNEESECSEEEEIIPLELDVQCSLVCALKQQSLIDVELLIICYIFT